VGGRISWHLMRPGRIHNQAAESAVNLASRSWIRTSFRQRDPRSSAGSSPARSHPLPRRMSGDPGDLASAAMRRVHGPLSKGSAR
jgi:hypothetical protein